MVNHSGISTHELRLHGVYSWACCPMTALDETLDVKGNKHHNGVIVTDKMRKYSEERRELSGLHLLYLLSIHDQPP